MPQLRPTRTVYTVGQFLDWQRNGSLELKPIFQRNAVWKPKAKSGLIDTLIRGLPIPIIFLRQVQDLENLTTKLEVVDGQQRLRSIFAYVNPTVLTDFSQERDSFNLLAHHNEEYGGKSFRELPSEIQADLLGYEISTHIFPPTAGDDIVLNIFARINSTGADLNAQELRNARFFGPFKSLSYELSFQYVDQWRRWRVFSEDDLARMAEVEVVSDILMTMMVGGIGAKTAKRLDEHYATYDDELRGKRALESKFNAVLSAIDEKFGDTIAETPFRRQALFFSLSVAVYAHLFGFGTYSTAKRANKLPPKFSARLLSTSTTIANKELPEDVQDAMDKATADATRRQARHDYFMKALGLREA